MFPVVPSPRKLEAAVASVEKAPQFRYRKLPLGLVDTDTDESVFCIGVFRLEASYMTQHGSDGMTTNASLTAIECPPNANEKVKKMFADEKEWIDKRSWGGVYGKIKIGREPTTVAKLVETREEAEKQIC